MKAAKRDQLFLKECKKELSIMRSKSHDYASQIDVLSNFKLTGAVTKITTPQVVLAEIVKKTTRLGELLGGKKPNNESIEDSIRDCRNYLHILNCVLKDD